MAGAAALPRAESAPRALPTYPAEGRSVTALGERLNRAGPDATESLGVYLDQDLALVM